MSTATLRRRIEKLESRSQRERRDPVVISNIGDRGEFYGEHGRFKTDAEMDEEERALRAAGRLRPNEDAVRLIMRIVDPAGNEVEPKRQASQAPPLAAPRPPTVAVSDPEPEAQPEPARSRPASRLAWAGYLLPHPAIQ